MKKILAILCFLAAFVGAAFFTFSVIDYDKFTSKHADVLVIIITYLLLSIVCLGWAWLFIRLGLKLVRGKVKVASMDISQIEDITLSYTNTRLDLYRFQIYHMFHSKGVMVFYTIIVMVFFAIILYTGMDAGESWSMMLKRLLVFGIVVVPVLVVFMLLVPLVSYIPWIDKNMLTPHRLHVSRDKLTEATSNNTSSYEWSAVTKVRMTKNHAIIYILKHLALVIPRRAFGGDAEFRQFHADVRSLYEQSRSAKKQG